MFNACVNCPHLPSPFYSLKQLEKVQDLHGAERSGCLKVSSAQKTGVVTAFECLQAAVHPEVLDELRKHFETQQECFASPFNCRWPSFCSMFADTDGPFGSRGDFFSFGPTQGSFEANPPFDQAFVARMTVHMHKLLNSALVRFAAVCLSDSAPSACWDTAA